MRLILLLLITIGFSYGIPKGSRKLSNMNGEYLISNPRTDKGFDTDYSSHENVEYFDVYSPPITTKYAEVYWTMMDAVPLDPDLVNRFHGKVMAIVGFEADQVFKTDEGDESVPITWAYNHHFEAYLMGANSEIKRVPSDIAHKVGHTYGQNVWHSFLKEGVDNTSNPEIPASQWFSEGNGGEWRKSFHGYPKGMAQLIESPTAFHLEPMQIDTRNRNYNGTDFKADILPKCSAAPPNATYSGLLECPCATRINKNITVSYSTATHGTCTTEIHTLKECEEAATSVGLPHITESKQVSDKTKPSGCFSITEADGKTSLYFNTETSSNKEQARLTEKSGQITSKEAMMTVMLKLDSSTSKATITMVGPEGKWFAASFNSPNFAMSDKPYTIVVDGTGNVSERKLARHADGSLIQSTVEVLLNEVIDGIRTIVLERDLIGATSDHHTFDYNSESIPMLFASGSDGTFAYHGKDSKGSGTLNIMSISSSLEIFTTIESREGSKISGEIISDLAMMTVMLNLDSSTSKATITMVAPEGRWFAASFNSPNFVMSDTPYTIVVDDTGSVSERKLATHSPGVILTSSVEVIFSEAIDGSRTIILERDFAGATSDHYTFDISTESIPMLFASGDGTFAYHGKDTKGSGTLNLMPINTATNTLSTVECGGGSEKSGQIISNSAMMSVVLKLDSSDSTATITMVSPEGKWFAAGFNSPNFAMSDTPYSIVVDGSGNVSERKLANHAPGSLIKSTVKVKFNQVVDGTRTVILERDFAGATSDHYTFNYNTESIPMIFASGSDGNFAYHGTTRGGGTLNMVSIGNPTCICYKGVSGTINNIPFSKNCLPEPKSDLLATKNPTCFVDTYQGGLACCHHQVVLLDKEQEQPQEEMTYHMKFRFWFQEYKKEDKKNLPSHQNLVRMYWQTEAWSTEYDVTKCKEGTSSENCVFEIKSNFTVRDMMQSCDVRKNPSCWGNTTEYDGVHIIYAGGHCHAPSCLSMELYNADTNELLCRHDPVYGKSHDIFDELGYLALPPCLYGPEDQGLMPPTFLSYDTNLYSVKRNNNTNAHYGEMASWQMRGVLAHKP